MLAIIDYITSCEGLPDSCESDILPLIGAVYFAPACPDEIRPSSRLCVSTLRSLVAVHFALPFMKQTITAIFQVNDFVNKSFYAHTIVSFLSSS